MEGSSFSPLTSPSSVHFDSHLFNRISQEV